MNDLTMIWNEVISMLDLQLNRIQLKNWIQPLTPIALDGDTLILDCTSAFIYSMVDKKYRQNIEQCVSYICEKPIRVELIHPGMVEYTEKTSLSKENTSESCDSISAVQPEKEPSLPRPSSRKSQQKQPPSILSNIPNQVHEGWNRENPTSNQDRLGQERENQTVKQEIPVSNRRRTVSNQKNGMPSGVTMPSFFDLNAFREEQDSQFSTVAKTSERRQDDPENFPSGEWSSREDTSSPDLENSEISISRRIQEKNRRLEQQRRRNGYTSLNPKYTMDSFVRGASNDFAYATAKAVIRAPGRIYNPLFIYGLSGLGKTHLMQAIAHEILNTDPEKRVLYITSENFMNEMIAVIENGTNSEKENFRHKYRSIDVLLIDDIQFIAGKKATMEEVFHTFNDLKEAGKQIVLSADKPPRELKNLEDRLVTRFEGGMTVDIQQPDFETRVAILNHKMKEESLDLPQYIIEFIADHITANIRELEGALLRVLAYFRYKEGSAHLSKEENLGLAREALKLEERSDTEISLDEIILRVAEYYHLKTQDMTSKSRQASIARPRQVAMYLCRELTNESLVSIGNAFSRDHTTIMHAVDKIAKAAREDETMRSDLETLTSQLKHT